MPRKKNKQPVTKDNLERATKELFQPFEKYYTLKKFDRNLKDYRNQIKFLYSKIFDKRAEEVRLERTEDEFRSLKIDNIYRKRRISAFVDVASAAAEKFEDKYPNICIEQELSHYCSELNIDMPDITDENDFITLAAALFILDSVKKSSNYDVAVYFIPHDERINDIILPHGFQDSEFSNDVIKGVMYLIKNRHGSDDVYYSHWTASLSAEKTGFYQYRQYAPEPEKKETDDLMTSFFDDYDEDEYIKIHDTAEKMTIRECYYALLSFIRPEITERAVKRFHDKCFELIEVVLHVSEVARNKGAELAKEAKSNIDNAIRVQKLARKCENKLDEKAKHFRDTKTLSVLSNSPQNGVHPETENISLLMSDYNTLTDKSDNFLEKFEENLKQLYNITVLLSNAFSKINYELTVKVNSTDFMFIKQFSIKNPYEIIFGFLYALDSADSFAWCPNITQCVCGYAVQQLPWNTKENEEFFDKVTEVMYNTADELEKSDYKRDKSYEKFYEDDEDGYEAEYALKYTDAFMFVRENFKYHKNDLLPYNLAQIVYSDSYVVPPRYAKDRYESVKSFVKAGFSRKQAELMCYYKAFADVRKNGKIGFEKVISTENLINERSADKLKKKSCEEMMETVSEKNVEIEELKKKLYSSERRVSELEKQISGIHEKHESDNQELIELRELIYKIQNSSGEEKEKQESNISFPYRTNARVVVFGGHATWLKVIVRLLPNVKFIDPYADPDVNTIRNADVVWMQTNAMPHNKYSKIMEIVRMKKIPVKYFAYASAEKCAIQLAEFDSGE